MVKTPRKTAKPRYLFLLRHAKAVAEGKENGDFDRPLSPRGEKDALKMAQLFLALGVQPDKVLCSPAQRTRQTLKALSNEVKGLKVSFPENLYLIDHLDLLARINRVKPEVSSLLVIGHNPGMENLALHLADPVHGGDLEGLARIKAKFPTGALVALRLMNDGWKNLASGDCRLEAFVRPADLETD